ALAVGRKRETTPAVRVGPQHLYDVATAVVRIGTLRRQRICLGVLARGQVPHLAQRAASERARIGPTLPERCLDVADCRPTNRQLYVMPRRPLPVRVGKRLRLGVATMPRVVSAAVAQVDAADVRDVQLRPPRMAQDDELLVVRAAGAYAHVTQALAA